MRLLPDEKLRYITSMKVLLLRRRSMYTILDPKVLIKGIKGKDIYEILIKLRKYLMSTPAPIRDTYFMYLNKEDKYYGDIHFTGWLIVVRIYNELGQLQQQVVLKYEHPKERRRRIK
jgi:hypothetical protein